MTDLDTPTKLIGYERIKETSRKFYVAKIHSNPEFYAKEKQRIKEYMKNRYNNDPEYAEKERQRNRDKYHNKKLRLIQNASNTAE
jgi:pyrroloquinoline quinone (PQQ) biosynthesis protein C